MKLRTQLFMGNVLVFVLVILIAGVSYQNTGSLLETEEWVSHTYEVISEAQLLQKQLVDMETGQRGFVITGMEEYLEPYNAANKSIETTIAMLKEIIRTPSQVELLEEIDALTAKWNRQAGKPGIEARRESIEAASALIKKRTGKKIMDALRDRISVFIEVEEELLAKRKKNSRRAAMQATYVIIFGTGLAILLGICAMLYITRNVLRQIGGEPALIAGIADKIAQGNLDVALEGDPKAFTGIRASIDRMTATLKDAARQASIIASGDYTADVAPRSDDDELGLALQKMTGSLRKSYEENERNDWLKTGLSKLEDQMRGELDIPTLCSSLISEMTTCLDAQLGAIFIMSEDAEKGQVLSLMGSYAYTKRKNLSNRYKLGEGLVGQAAMEKQQILVRNVPEDYVKVTSGLGEALPRFICVTPFMHENKVKGVVEIGSLHEVTDVQLEYLNQAMAAIGINVQSAQGRMDLAVALEESQAIGEELQSQQEELRTSNEELEEQTQMLQQSEQKLKAQQEELQVTNEELEEKTESLQGQKAEIERKNKDLNQTREEIEIKAEELAIASKYKSEFLANMSHELRTPLNSLLLLAEALADNPEGNLSQEQKESADVIHKSGSDLLSLINEILDLSRIEAGRMELLPETVAVRDLASGIKADFRHMADKKGLRLDVRVGETAPARIVSDRKRVEQVLRNLVSNAMKFTSEGGITITFAAPPGDAAPRGGRLERQKAFAISVEDTGIGIPADKQKIIFEAFQQVEGGTARKYSGTGLGLSITREIVNLLGGEIRLVSEEGKGSTFTVFLPIRLDDTKRAAGQEAPEPAGKGMGAGNERVAQGLPGTVEHVPDDRDQLEEKDSIILVIEDDPKFAKLLLEQCRGKGLKCLVAPTGEEGLVLTDRHRPKAVILDIRLPGMDGWAVLETLKDNPATRHIPVHIISVDDVTIDAFKKGAIGYLMKPVTKEELDTAFGKMENVFKRGIKNLLVVEDDKALRKSIIKLVGNGDVHSDEAGDGEETIRKLKSRTYDCMIMDLGLPDMSGFELMKKLEDMDDIVIPPVIVYTGRELTREEDMELRSYAESIIIKGVRSEERLLDEASLFLHRVVAKMPEKKRKIITDLHDTDGALRDRKILIVDDDMRNVFALSKVLESKGMNVLKAEDGQKALTMLDEEHGIDLVLMDIMMPVMDGYETMKRIRAKEKHRKLPIIALTAKAMKEDSERCIAAGANDYIAKPVDVGRLCSIIRVWLYR